MNREIPYELIAKFLSGHYSDLEKEQLEQWKNSDAANKAVFDEMKITWQEVPQPTYEPDVDAALNKVHMRMQDGQKKTVSLNKLWVGIAAAFIIGLGIFGVFKISGSKTHLQTIETIAGAKLREVVLPDGSKVILNQNSKLIFPEKFRGNKRDILFSGEAYFIVTPDKTKPFIISSGTTTTKVLGTEFNLCTQTSDSIIRLTVTKGLVSFNMKENKELKEVIVAAGEVGEADLQSGGLKKLENSNPNFMAWRNGILTFENQDLRSAIQTISAYYNIEFKLAPGLDTVRFSSTFDSISVKQAIENMQLILDVDIAFVNGVYLLRQKS